MSIDSNKPDFPKILKRFGIHPDKQLGQHFLIDHSSLNQIIDSADLSNKDSILEVGAGTGNLTCLLASRVKRVVAVEKDTKLIPVLREFTQGQNNVEIIAGDILEINLHDLFTSSEYSVVANIPYYITSKLIRLMLESNMPPERMVLTVQKEVAERICAAPGKMNVLAVSVQIYGRPQILFRIPASSFYPPPEVDSAVLRIDRYGEPLIPAERLFMFFRLVKAGFSQKRKNLRNSLSAGMHWSPGYSEEILNSVNIDPKRRAETVTLTEWSHLTDHVMSQASLNS